MRILLFAVSATAVVDSTVRGHSLTQSQAAEALHKAVGFFRTKAGYQGAYLYRYSADLKKQEGEGVAHRTTGWTQPPGTPAVGEAYLNAWRLSDDGLCLEAAREAADALIRTQLVSGGWDSRFELDPQHRRGYMYRVDGKNAGKRNETTFDDNKSQSALMLLMHVDEAMSFEDAKLHDAVEYAIAGMLAAQYPNGAWPQRFSGPPDASKHPVKHASYPESWSREFPGRRYAGYYTLNDNNMSYIIEMLFEANRIYGREDCLRAAEQTGEFFLLAQMPDPQPGWAQQYDANMHPAWARKFEPPAVTGGESQVVMRSLLKLYRHTGNKRFIKPLPRALAYYRESLLADGRLARFYELRTNNPLYFTKDYKLTYSDSDLPTHYGFNTGSRLESIEQQYRQLLQTSPDELRPDVRVVRPVALSSEVAKRAQAVVDAMDSRGAWVEDGRLRYHGDDDDTRHVIESRTFIRNLVALARFVGAKP